MQLSLSALYCRVSCTAVIPLSAVLLGMHFTVLLRVLFSMRKSEQNPLNYSDYEV